MKIAAFAIIARVLLSGTQTLAETGYLTKNYIAYCEENHEQYKLLGRYQFLEREQRTMRRVYVSTPWRPSLGLYRGKPAPKAARARQLYVNVEIEQGKCKNRHNSPRKTTHVAKCRR